MRVQTRRTLLLLPVFTLLLTLYPIGVAQGEPGSGTANLRVSLPAGTFINSSDPDPWLDEGWLLNLTGASWTFTVRVTEISNAHVSYDTHLIVALNNASYENITDLTINGTAIPKEAFQYGTPEPYNLGWIWPDDVYPTWFNDNVSLGTIDPFESKEVNVSATWDPTGARMHFDAYGKAVDEIQKVGDIIWTPNSEDSTVVSAPGILPHASFNWEPETPYVNNNVTFNATASYDPDGYIEWYYWNFGDGTPLVNITNPVTIHNYTTAGNYSVTLTVGDNASLTDTDSQPITVVKHPVARFTYSSVRGDEPAYPHVGDNVTFDASASTPDGGNITSYEWDFGDGTNDTGMIVNHTYTTSGTFTVTLNVTDSTGLWDTETKPITITVIDYPVANFTVLPLGPPYYAGVELTFNASLSTPNGGNITSYAWDFGDGTTEIYVKDVNLTATATHTYTTNGTYTVTLNVTDSEDLWDIATTTLTVYKRDVAVISVVPAKNQVYPTWIVPLNITVTVLNNGTEPANFTVTAYYDTYIIGTQNVTNLDVGEQLNLTFSWNLTGLEVGFYNETVSNYNVTVRAYLAEDVNPDNNEFVVQIKIKLPGDVDGDGSVGGGDLGALGWAWGTIIGMPKYDQECDFDHDGSIGGGDLGILGWNWGKTVTY